MALLNGVTSRQKSLAKPQVARHVYINADNPQSLLDVVKRSAQRSTGAHLHGSPKPSTNVKDFPRVGKQVKHIHNLEAVVPDGNSADDSNSSNNLNASKSSTRLHPIPLKLVGTAWWNVKTTSDHPPSNLTFVTSALDMRATGDSKSELRTSRESVSPHSFDLTTEHEPLDLARDSDLGKSDSVYHLVEHQSEDTVPGTNVQSIFDKASASQYVDKPLPAKPTLRIAESPERRGIIDAFESGVQALNETHPALEADSPQAVNSDVFLEKMEETHGKALDKSPQAVHEKMETEKRLYEENVRRVCNKQSIKSINILKVEVADTTQKDIVEIVQQNSSPSAKESPTNAPRSQQFSRIPQANVSIYGSPIARKTSLPVSSGVFSSRSLSGLSRVASRLQIDDLKPPVSPRIKYGRSALRVDPEADNLILGDDPAARVTNSFRSMRSLHSSKETENLILGRCKTLYQRSPSRIPTGSAEDEKFPPRISSLKGSPEVEKIEKKFGKSTNSPQSPIKQLNRPTASSTARAADPCASTAERDNVSKKRSASGTTIIHSSRKSFSGRLSSMLPRRRTKSSPNVKEAAQQTQKAAATTNRTRHDGGRGGCNIDKRAFGFRKYKALSNSIGRDEKVDTNFLTDDESEQKLNSAAMVKALQEQGRQYDNNNEENANHSEEESSSIVKQSLDASPSQTNPSPLECTATYTAGIGARIKSGSDAIRGGRTRTARHTDRPLFSRSPRANNTASSSMVQYDAVRNRPTSAVRAATAGPSVPGSGSGQSSTVNHINASRSSVTSRTSPLHVLDSVNPSVQEQYNETRTTRMLNTLMVDARHSLDRARAIAANVHDSDLRKRLLDLVQDERNMLNCLHHARRAHLAAGVTMFDLFRNVTNHVNELVDRSIDTVVNEEPV